MAPTLGTFLQPTGFDPPRLAAALREGSVLGEAGRHLLWAAGERRTRRATPYAARTTGRGEPVVLVPGFLAGDATLGLMARALRLAQSMAASYRVPVVVECVLERVTNIAMGTEIDKINEFEAIDCRHPQGHEGLVTAGLLD